MSNRMSMAQNSTSSGDPDATIIEKAKNYAVQLHSDTNHQYDGQAYAVHLQMVFDFAKQYKGLLPEEFRAETLAAAWTHDLIEDCRVSYNDVKRELGEQIAEITYALTNEKGKTRKERANDKYYDDMKKNEGALFIKLCDRMANVAYSKSKGSRMFDVYKKENEEFDSILRVPKLNEMFDDLSAMFS